MKKEDLIIPSLIFLMASASIMTYHTIDAVSYDIITVPPPGFIPVESERLYASWETDRAFVTIGTTFVDVYTTTNSNGEAQRIDTTGMSTVTFQTLWSKLLGLGTQDCQIVDVSNSSNVLITSDSLIDGINTKADVSIPDSLENTIKSYKPQCKSTTGVDSPTWLGGQILLKP